MCSTVARGASKQDTSWPILTHSFFLFYVSTTNHIPGLNVENCYIFIERSKKNKVGSSNVFFFELVVLGSPPPRGPHAMFHARTQSHTRKWRRWDTLEAMSIEKRAPHLSCWGFLTGSFIPSRLFERRKRNKGAPIESSFEEGGKGLLLMRISRHADVPLWSSSMANEWPKRRSATDGHSSVSIAFQLFQQFN